MQFDELYLKLKRPIPQHPVTIGCIDPGETTGWAAFVLSSENQFLPRIHLDSCGQEDTGTIRDVTSLGDLIEGSDILVVEDYRVYSWRASQHTWSPLHTAKLIGAIEALYWLSRREYSSDNPAHHMPIVFQMAVEAKDFCTDEKLTEWGFYQRGQRHARDAIRHGCRYLLFDKELPQNSLLKGV